MSNFNVSVKKENKGLFNYSFIWNIFDSFATQIILIFHNIFLRHSISSELHGKFVNILSIFYFFITFANFGLDYTISCYLKEFIQNNKHLNYLIKRQVLPQLILNLFLCIIFLFINNFFGDVFNFSINFELSIILSFAFISEGLKRIIKNFLQLILKSKYTAIIEVIGLYIYILIIWGSCFCGKVITLNYLFFFYALISLGQLAILICFFYRYYLILNIENKNIKDNGFYLNNNIFKARLNNFIIQMSSQLYSSNFILSICSYYLTFSQLSLIKIYWSIIQFIVNIINRNISIFVFSLYNDSKNYIKLKNMFIKNTYFLTKIFYILMTLFFINLVFLLYDYSLYFILFIPLLESFLLFYEKFFIIEGYALRFALFNIINIIFLYFFYKLYFKLFFQTNLFLIIGLILFRICTLILIAYTAKQKL